jgi:hypothetical protein
LAESIRNASGRPVHVVKALKDVVPTLLTIVRPGDAVITLGAGSIGTLPKTLMQALTQPAPRSPEGEGGPVRRSPAGEGGKGA